ncbi:MAG TPA: phosphatase PAP2 family protein [Terriglobia bacterium]|jgi:hypothetical protein
MKTHIWAACIVLIALNASRANAQPAPPALSDDLTQPETQPLIQSQHKYLVMPASFDILRDERAIWKDMFRPHEGEAKWVIPIVGVNALAISTDAFAYKNFKPSDTVQTASHAVSSLGAPYPLFAAGASMYLIGRYTDDLRLRETGILGTQALVHSIIMTGVFESATNRKQPNGSGGTGFWKGGDAWPSGHASMFWALSTVVAEQYHDSSPVRYGAYLLATAVSVSRFTGRQHFPSDALASSLVGYLVGRWVVHHRSTTRN